MESTINREAGMTAIQQVIQPVVAKTLRSAVVASAKTGETLYIIATYNGPQITRTRPTFMSYYEVAAGDARYVAYEPWNA